MIVKWDITSACNLHCKHCCTGGQYYKNTPSLELQEAARIIESLARAGVTRVQFTGGEPLLREDLPEVLDLCAEQGLAVVINTNGLLMKGRWLDPARLMKITTLVFSLDGPDASTHEAVRGKNTFAPLIENISATVRVVREAALPVRIHINSVLSVPVVDRAADFVRLVHALGVDQFGINVAVVTENVQRYPGDFDGVTWERKYRFIETMVREALRLDVDVTFDTPPLGTAFINYLCGSSHRTVFHCGAARTGVYVQADGTVHPCMRATQELKPLLQRAPSLRTDDIRDVTSSRYFKRFGELEQVNLDALEPCRTCKFKEHCSPCRFEYANGVVTECMYVNEALAAVIEARCDTAVR